jgi:hypothetical protein
MHSLLITLSIISIQLGALPDETVDSIQQKVIENRMKIDSAVFSIHFVMKDTGGKEPVDIDNIMDVYYEDENKARSDLKTTKEPVPEKMIDGMGNEIIVSPGLSPSQAVISCFGGGKHYDYVSGSEPPGFLLTMQNTKSFRSDNIGQGCEMENSILDPKTLGLIPFPTTASNRFNLRSFIGSEASKNGTVEKGTWKNKPCYIVIFNTDKSQIRYWAVPEMDYSVASIESKFPLNKLENPSIHYRIKTEYQKDSKTGIWFPKQIGCKGLRNGKSYMQENSAIKLISLNEPIDPEVFTPKGMGVYVGNTVRDKDLKSQARLMWDGEQVVTASGEPLPGRGISDFNRKVIIAAGAILLLISFVITTRVRRTKKTKAEI